MHTALRDGTPPPDGADHLILGIETSCDDTACALVSGKGDVLASIVSSQSAAHQPFGGVVPELASREHLANWPFVVREALQVAGVELESVTAIAATRGPGLVGSLLVGFSIAKALAYSLGRPFLAVNHLEGHLYSPFLSLEQPALPIPDRFVGLVVSGGHTQLVGVRAGECQSFGQTRDDAMGEAFDKVGKRIGLAFPGGPHVDAIAEDGPEQGTNFKVPRCQHRLDFSYSGLKTEVMRRLARLAGEGIAVERGHPAHPSVVDLVVGFRQAAVAQLIDRLEALWRQEAFSSLAISGGCAANALLRREATHWAARRSVQLFLVEPSLSGDNAAMIAWAGRRNLRRGHHSDPLDSDVVNRLPLGEPHQ